MITIPRSLRPLIVSLVPGQQKELNKAKKMREELQAEVSATIEEFGPKMHDDFDEVSDQKFAKTPCLTGLTSGESFHLLLFLPPATRKDAPLAVSMPLAPSFLTP